MSDVLSIEGLSVVYETGKTRRVALDEVSLSLSESEIVGVVGESGCGKSTLGLSTLRLLPPNAVITQGSINFDGRDLCHAAPEAMRSIRGQEISMIFQDPTASLNPRLPIGTQLEQIEAAHRGRGRHQRSSFRQHAIAQLEEVGLPDPAGALDRYPYEFSGGMRQRVMIAMALLLEPRVIIADEATSALDVTLEAQILELLLRLRDRHGTAMIYVSHDLGVVAQLCDRVAVMYAGRVVEEMGDGQISERAHHPYTQALEAAIPKPRSRGKRLATIAGSVPDLSAPATSCSFAPRCTCAQSICTEQAPSLYPFDDGVVSCFAYSPELGAQWSEKPSVANWTFGATEDPFAPEPELSRDDATPLLEMGTLSVHFSRGSALPFGRTKSTVRAVDGVSMTLERGHILGIVGESGSGKTTLGEAIVKLRPPTHGSLVFAGRDVSQLSARETRQFRRRVQMIFQSPHSSLSPRMSVGSIVTEPYEIFDVPETERQSIDGLLANVGLPADIQHRYPNQISGGQARRVGIARALVLSPELLVADEPTSGLDSSSAGAIVNLLTDLRAEKGLSIVMISHNLSLVSSLADEVAVMYFGQIVENGPVADVLTAPAHPYTKALLALAPGTENSGRTIRRELLVPGEIPSADAPPSGCRFHPRCIYSQDICRDVEPKLVSLGAGLQLSACHFASELRATGSLEVGRR